MRRILQNQQIVVEKERFVDENSSTSRIKKRLAPTSQDAKKVYILRRVQETRFGSAPQLPGVPAKNWLRREI